MSKRRIIPDPVLMLITILVITGFQGYWLKNNYDREKKTLEIKTNVAFQETVRGLQMIKLKLKNVFGDSSIQNFKTRIRLGKDLPDSNLPERFFPKREVVTMVNAMGYKLRDSLKKGHRVNSDVVISMNKDKEVYGNDITFEKHMEGDRIFQVLYGLDSLQDSLRLPEITMSYKKTLADEKLSVPFTILRSDTIAKADEPGLSDVTVGFAHPISYHLELGNTLPYLLKKLTLPILFSIFLVGVTILSFVVLYRNLLRQQRLAEIKNEFISNITHELKTPISTVGVAIEALKNFNAIQDPQKTKEYLDISSNELQRLGLLVDKVLKLSMFEKKEIELKYETVNLKDVVDEVVTSMRLQIEKYHARVSVVQDGDVILQADRLHLLSVVFNLLDNALKYSKGEPSVKIELKGSNNQVQLNIIDNGIGISQEYKDKIFEKFFRVPTGDTHNAKGYGLGLSYVAHVVKKHGGRISVESQPGIGTGFMITLPTNHT